MNDITTTQRRTQAYWFVDGLGELIGGAALAAVGALMHLSVAVDNEGFATMALGVMILGFPLSAKAVRWAKDHLTHRRTGYVSYPAPSARRRTTSTIIAAVLGIVFTVSAVSLGERGFDGTLGTYMLLGLGAGVAVALAARASLMSMPRFYLSAIVVATSAIWSVAQELGFIAGMGVVWIALGLASLITGGIALGQYLRAPSGLAGEAE